MSIPIILASASARRHELLSRLDLPFTTISAEIDECVFEGEAPDDYIMRMVKSKAEATRVNVMWGLVITADTIGVMDGSILTKPVDKTHAFDMWDRLSGNKHEVWTAVCASLVQDDSIIHQKIIKVVTDVIFVTLTDEQKERYWQTGEPNDKAGAYAIQGGAMSWVRAINGSYSNVVGLPLAQTEELIHEMLGLASMKKPMFNHP